MFTFLHPAVLFGLAAVALPLLIHLFTRQKSKVIYFSTLRFLHELQKQQIRRLKIRQVLLLLLRVLIVLLLILAFARPTFKTSAAVSADAGAHLTAVIILDNTLSMGAESKQGRLIEIAKKRARELLIAMRNGDEIYLLHPTDPPRFAYEEARYSLQSVREAIDEVELSYHSTDILAAIEMGTQLLNASANVNRELYLITDKQKTGLNAGKRSNVTPAAEDVRFYLLPVVGTGVENLSVTDLTLETQVLEKGKVVQLTAAVKNNGSRPVQGKLVHLFVNGKRVGQNVVSLQPGASDRVVFRYIPENAGFQQAFVQLEEDGLPPDDRRYVSFHVPEAIRVLLVGARQQDTHYLNLALTPDQAGSSTIRAAEITFQQLNDHHFEDFDVIVLSNVPKVESTGAVKLQSYVESGGGLMIFLGPDVDVRHYNSVLHAKLQLPQLTQPISGSADQFLSLGKIDFSHPLFRGVFEDKKGIASPHIRVAVGVASNKPLNTVIAYHNNQPFLFESKHGRGRILYITTSFGNQWSDLSLRGLFVPLMNRAVIYLTGVASFEQAAGQVGEELYFAIDDVISAAELVVHTPGQAAIRIQPEVRNGRYSIRFGQTDIPGIYTLKNGETTLHQWAVNIAGDESDVATFDVDELAARTGFAEIVEVPKQADVTEILQQRRFGREIWRTLMMAALVLVLVEMMIFRERAVA